MNIIKDIERYVKKKGNLIYKVHTWTGLLSVVGLIILSLTGLLLLCKGSISQWNNMGVQPPAQKVYASEELWSHLIDGLGEIDRHFPGRKVLAVSPDTRRGLLRFTLEADEGSKVQEKKVHGHRSDEKGELFSYDVEKRTVNGISSPVYRSEFLRSIVRISYGVHAGTSFAGLKLIWIITAILAIAAIITGFLFQAIHCTAPLGRITVPKLNSRQFWSDSHRLTGAVVGIFLLVLSFSGIMQPFVTEAFTKDLKEHERLATDYFAKIDADYGKVSPKEVLLPSEAMRRLREHFSVEQYRLLSIKLPTQANDFYSFYLTTSPYGTARYNAVELVGMRPDGENIFVVSPSPAVRLLAGTAQLHRTWSMNGLVKFMWGIYLICSLMLMVSGIYIHARRHQGQSALPQGENKPSSMDKFVLPLLFSVLVGCSFLSVLFDTSGMMAAVMLIIPILIAVYKMKKEN